MKKVFYIFLFSFFFIFSSGLHVAQAVDIGLGAGTDIGSGLKRQDERYVDVTADDIDIWDNGNGISLSGGGETYSVGYQGSQYYVLVSKYLDLDGQYTVQADILLVDQYAWLDTNKIFLDEDESIYGQYVIYGKHGFSWNANYYSVRIRGKLFQSTTGEWTETPAYCFFDTDTSSDGCRLGKIYISPFFDGKYQIYSSYEYVDTSDYNVGFPVNLLPNAPMGAGSTSIPYKTTFRMLTGDTTVYNTFYYTSSYKSGADTISAAGTIRLDATKLADGSVTRTRLSAPQLLCQISSYGTAYDIAYTNDDNLCALLGISKPAEKYWDVSEQEWKLVSSGIIGGGIGAGAEIGSGVSKLPWLNVDLSMLENFALWLQEEGFPTHADNAVDFLLWNNVEAIDKYLDELGDYLNSYFDYFEYNPKSGAFAVIADGVRDGWVALPEAPVVEEVKKEFLGRLKYDEINKYYRWTPNVTSTIIPGLGAGLESSGDSSGNGSGTGDSSGTGTGTVGGSSGEGDTTLGNGVVDALQGIASMVKEIVQAFKELLANIGEMGSVVKILFGFLPPEMIGFIRITIYGCLFIAFYKAVRG